MSKSNGGGQAFPVGMSYSFNPGMTLRDYFAASVLSSVIKTHQEYIEKEAVKGGNGSVNDIAAKISYAYADAMLKARDNS